MKKLLALSMRQERRPTLFFLGLLALLAWPLVSPAMDLVKDGRAVTPVFIQKDELAAPGNGDLQVALEELNLHFQKMASVDLQIITVEKASEVKRPAIVLGKLCADFSAKPFTVQSRNHEGYRLECQENLLLIWGESARGTLNGVYDLLGRLGCAWVMPGDAGMITPKEHNIGLDPCIGDEVPGFPVRSLWFGGGSAALSDKERATIEIWMRRMRLTSTAEKSTAHDLMMRGGHFWGKVITKNQEFFEAHPEMLALVRQPDGSFVRKGPQLETSNSKVVDLFVQTIRDEFAENHWPADKKVCLSISPSDGLGFSESAENLQDGDNRYDPFYGERGRSDDIVLLANRIFQRLGSVYPNLYLGEYLYGVHSDYPSRYKPDPHFLNVAADITFSRFHSTVDNSSPSRFFYKSILDRWAQLDNPIYFRGYNWNLAEATLPYSKARIWGEDLKYYYEHHFFALDVEAIAAWATTGSSDFVFARMAWNPEGNWRDYLEEYCRASFGRKAGDIMEKIYLAQIGRQHDSVNEAGSFNAFPLTYDLKFTRKMLSSFQEAEIVAKTEQEKTLIKWQRYPWDQLERFLELKKHEKALEYVEANRCYDEMVDAFQALSNENALLVGRPALRYLKSFLYHPIKEGLECTTGASRVLARIPEMLSVRFDPYDRGEDMGFFLSPRKLDNLLRIHTYNSTWDAQGLAPLRKGSIWYYSTIDIPAVAKTRRVGLFLGNLEDESRVWINGQKGGSSRGYGKPHIYDISSLIRPGANAITIAVRRVEMQEIGVGGLMAPAFVFSSDRIPVTTGNQETDERVLPGGEHEKISH